MPNKFRVWLALLRWLRQLETSNFNAKTNISMAVSWTLIITWLILQQRSQPGCRHPHVLMWAHQFPRSCLWLFCSILCTCEPSYRHSPYSSHHYILHSDISWNCCCCMDPTVVFFTGIYNDQAQRSWTRRLHLIHVFCSGILYLLTHLCRHRTQHNFYWLCLHAKRSPLHCTIIVQMYRLHIRSVTACAHWCLHWAFAVSALVISCARTSRRVDLVMN